MNVVIVGAGPATLGLLCNAMKTNRLKDLVERDGGLAILEQGDCFGGGGLQYYGINSNTSANGFMKCTFRKKKEVTLSSGKDAAELHKSPMRQPKGMGKTPQSEKAEVHAVLNLSQAPKPKGEVSDDDVGDAESERDDLPLENPGLGAAQQPHGNLHSPQRKPTNSKSYIYTAHECFKDLVNTSEIFQAMHEYGSHIVPLSLVGMYMNYAGNHLLAHIYQAYNKAKVFHGGHRVVSIQLLANGEVLVTALRKQIVIKKNELGGNLQVTEQDCHVQFRANAVVLSNGGSQHLHPHFYQRWFPFMKAAKERVLLADHFMQRDKYVQVMENIKKNKIKNIVIIGGSASGFSTAWLLLKGPATHKHGKQGEECPTAKLKALQNCRDCCICHIAKKPGSRAPCQCQCRCFGFFQFQRWNFDPALLDNCLGEGSIKILYRDRIRVFYSTVQQARLDGYTDFSEKFFSRKDGYLYSYTGLRGNAKSLYKRVINGQEKRITLVQAPTPKEQEEHVRAADLVIWACGYQTNRIQVKNHEGKEIPLC